MHYVGIDISKDTFTATLLTDPESLVFFGETFENTESGFKRLLKRVDAFDISNETPFIMEATGVYGERLSTFLYKADRAVYVEPPVKISRAFRDDEKTDPIDSRMIAEYGFRYRDQLHAWKPKDRIVEEIRVLMVNRELFVKQRTASKNVLKAMKHKTEQELKNFYQEQIDFLSSQINTIEKAMKTTFQQNAVMQQHVTNLDTIPGVGLIFIANFFDVTDGFSHINYRSLAKYLGIIPRRHQSGTSVKKRPRSKKTGPARMRKQLFLSSMTSIKTEGPLKEYFYKRQATGKNGKIVLRIIANKLLKIACAVVLSSQPYDPEYKSIHLPG
jgi:transposase